MITCDVWHCQISNNAKEEHATMPTKELRMTEYFPLVRCRLAQVLGVLILWTPDPRNWGKKKKVPVKRGFRYAQVPFKKGFTVFPSSRQTMKQGPARNWNQITLQKVPVDRNVYIKWPIYFTELSYWSITHMQEVLVTTFDHLPPIPRIQQNKPYWGKLTLQQ